MERGDRYTIEDMLRMGWIDEEDAQLLRKADAMDDRRVQRILDARRSDENLRRRS